jgi:hypothetical protein
MIVRPTLIRSLALLVATASLAIACTTTPAAPTADPTDQPTPTQAATQPPTTAPSEPPTTAPTETPTEAPTEAPTASPSLAPTASPNSVPTGAPSASPGGSSAQVQASGDITTTLELPYVPGDSEFPAGDGSFDLVFMDESQNTLRLTLDIAGQQLTDAFVAVGLPGTGLDDATYFADFFRTQCEVSLSMLDATAVEGTFTCPGLENGAGDQTIDTSGSFSVQP